MRDSLAKAVRLVREIQLFEAGGYYRTQDLAERLRVSRRTIERDLLDLQGEPFYLPLVEEERWWHLLRLSERAS
jgi:predicted DNA-binding transcriptional regulator YafY